MIEPLKRIVSEINEAEGTETTRLPNTREMMEKVNEVINTVNRIEGHVKELNMKERSRALGLSFPTRTTR